MRASMIAAAFAAAVAAVPAPAFTLTKTIDVYTTVWADDMRYGPPATSSTGRKWGKFGGWPRPTTANHPAAAAATPVQAPAAAAPAAVQAPAAPAAAPAAPAADVAAAPTTAPTYAQTSGADSYQKAVIAHHNAHRANHSAADLVWSSNLASIAQQIAASCKYAHNTKAGGGGYGQNIAAGAPASNISSVITDLFYNNEVENFNGLYGQATPSNINDMSAFDGWGHFTQIVWKGTTSIGCYTQDCSSTGLANTGSSVPPYFTVCNYSPPGNYIGEFAKNVARPDGVPSINWSYA